MKADQLSTIEIEAGVVPTMQQRSRDKVLELIIEWLENGRILHSRNFRHFPVNSTHVPALLITRKIDLASIGNRFRGGMELYRLSDPGIVHWSIKHDIFNDLAPCICSGQYSLYDEMMFSYIKNHLDVMNTDLSPKGGYWNSMNRDIAAKMHRASNSVSSLLA